MKTDCKKQIIDLLDQYLSVKQAHVNSAKSAARNYAAQAIESHSVNALRPNAEFAVDFAKTMLIETEKLRDEIINSPDTSPEKVTIPSLITIKQDDNQKQLLFTKSNVQLPGMLIVTPKSPLGQMLTNKKVGASFSLLGKKYQILGIS